MPRLDRDDEIAPTLVRVGAYLCSGVLALMDAPGSHVEPGVPRSGSPREAGTATRPAWPGCQTMRTQSSRRSGLMSISSPAVMRVKIRAVE